MPANTPRGYTYPLYSDPANFPSQIQDFAQDVDLDVAAQVAATNTALNRSSARILATANQAITQNVTTTVTFATEEYDNAAMGNLGVNNERLTFTSTGIYLINADITFASNGNATLGTRSAWLEFNAATTPVGNSRRGSQSVRTCVELVHLHNVTAIGQFVRVRVRQESGAALNITTRSLSATKVAG